MFSSNLKPFLIYVVLSILSSIILYRIDLVDAQFPAECVEAENLTSKICCPTPEGFTDQCGGEGRGSCEFLTPSPMNDYQPHYQFQEGDDRYAWPSKFFDYACQCEWPFSGAGCADCVWGYYGSECDDKWVNVRRNILLSDVDQTLYIDYITWLKGNTSNYKVMTKIRSEMFHENGSVTPEFVSVNEYDLLTWVHYYTTKHIVINDFIFSDIDFGHLGPNFLPWHRSFLLIFERKLQKISGDYHFALPYWDWADKTNCEICTDDYFGSNDENGMLTEDSAFFAWPELCSDFIAYDESVTDVCDPGIVVRELQRLPGIIGNELPTKKEIGFVLNQDVYDTPPYNVYSDCSFRNLMGGNVNTTSGLNMYLADARAMHGAVHLYLGGTMGTVPSSTNDPIFYPHHTFVDKLLEMWIRRHNATSESLPYKGAPMGHNRGSYSVPFFPVWSNEDAFQPSIELGYIYDNVNQDGFTPDQDQYNNDNLGMCGFYGDGTEPIRATLDPLIDPYAIYLLLKFNSTSSYDRDTGTVSDEDIERGV